MPIISIVTPEKNFFHLEKSPQILPRGKLYRAQLQENKVWPCVRFCGISRAKKLFAIIVWSKHDAAHFQFEGSYKVALKADVYRRTMFKVDAITDGY